MANIGSGSGSGYPSAIDTQSPPESGTTLARSDVPNDLAAAIIAVQTELGTDPAGTETDVKTYLQAEHRLDGTHGDMTSTKLTMVGDFLFSVGSSIASASLLILGDGTIFDVTGTVNINRIGTKGVGGYIILSFSDVLSLNDDDDDLKLGGGNLITKDGTAIPLYEYAVGKWRLVGFNHSSPPKIGDVTPNTVKATTFEGSTGGTTINEFSTDGTLAGDSDDAVPTEKAVKTAIAAAGKVLQVVMTTFNSVLSTAIIMPQDDTIPQNTEGVEVMTQAITPKSTASNLIIEVVGLGHQSTSDDPGFTLALFKDTDGSAIAAIGVDSEVEQAARQILAPLTLGYTEASGSLTARTYKVRMGANVTSTFTFNGVSSARIYGDIAKSSIKITEVLP